MAPNENHRREFADQLVAEALELTGADRREFLDKACAANAVLRAEVDLLIAKAEKAGHLTSTRSMTTRGLYPGEVINSRWKIVCHIASGGMGDVYEAEDQYQHHRRVALKAVRPEVASDPKMVSRFKREVLIAQNVTDRNVCRVYDFDYHRLESGDSLLPYMTMELLRPGQTLARFIDEQLANSRPLPAAESLPLFKQITSGLAALHKAGYIHRDVKPQNIMMVQERSGQTRVVVTDLGLAMRVLPGHTAAASYMHRVGRSGTPEYMAPEQVVGGELCEATDVYGLGVVMFQMLTGVLPFSGNTRNEVAEKRLFAAPPVPSSIVPELRGTWDDTILRCLERDPEKRYRSCRELLDALEAGPPATRQLAAPWARARLTAVVCLLLAFASAAWVAIGRYRGPSLPAEQRVAVLKFTNIGADPAAEAFSEGLMETLTSRLTQMELYRKSLCVIPASDVRKAKLASVRGAQQEFNANIVITGSIQKSKQGFYLTLNLVDARQLKQLRSRNAFVSQSDSVAAQDSLVNELAALLDVPLRPEARQDLTKGNTNVAGAYDMYVQGRGYLMSGAAGIDPAIESFQNALELDHRYALAYAGLSEAYWSKYQSSEDRRWLDEAWKLCRQALAIDSSLAPVHTAVAVLSSGIGDYATAIAHARKAVKLDPTNYRAYAELAAALDATSKPAEAEETLKAAIALRPEYWNSHVRLGTFYFHHGRYQAAERAFTDVARLVPENPVGYTNLGAIYHMQGREKEAEEVLRKSLTLRSTPLALSNLATVYFFQRRYSEAVPVFEKLVTEGSQSYRIWGNLGDAYRWTPDAADKARKAYRRAIDLTRERLSVNAHDVDALSCESLYLAKSGDTVAAIVNSNRAVRAAPKDPDVLYDAAVISELAAQRDRALSYLRRAIAEGYSLNEIRTDPELKEMRSDARYANLVRDHDKAVP